MIRLPPRPTRTYPLFPYPPRFRSNGAAAPIVVRFVLRGLADELHDRHYLIVDGIDGRTHYADIGKGEAHEPLQRDAIVRIVPRTGGVRQVDRTIAEVAVANEGRSEEHTSELQSLMRISYAVLCLKKTKQTHTQTSNQTNTK